MLHSAQYDGAMLTPPKNLVQGAAMCIFATDLGIIKINNRRWPTGATCIIAQ
jgi:hypothetical protein